MSIAWEIPAEFSTKKNLKIFLGLDSLCPTSSIKIFADMKSCEQIWLVTGAFAI